MNYVKRRPLRNPNFESSRSCNLNSATLSGTFSPGSTFFLILIMLHFVEENTVTVAEIGPNVSDLTKPMPCQVGWCARIPRIWMICRRSSEHLRSIITTENSQRFHLTISLGDSAVLPALSCLFSPC
jgi:hypothetical protein